MAHAGPLLPQLNLSLTQLTFCRQGLLYKAELVPSLQNCSCWTHVCSTPYQLLCMPCRQGRLYSGLYSNSITDAATLYPSTSYLDDMALACMWLWQRTGVTTLLSEAQTYLQQHEAQETTVGAALRRPDDVEHSPPLAWRVCCTFDNRHWRVVDASAQITTQHKLRQGASKPLTMPVCVFEGGYSWSRYGWVPAATKSSHIRAVTN